MNVDSHRYLLSLGGTIGICCGFTFTAITWHEKQPHIGSARIEEVAKIAEDIKYIRDRLDKITESQ